MNQFLCSFGYMEILSDQHGSTFELADASEISACVDKSGLVSFWRRTKTSDRTTMTRLFGSADLEETRTWLQSANAKGLYRCVDSPEERQHI